MKSAIGRWLRSIALVVMGGLVIAIAAFFVTSFRAPGGYLLPLYATYLADPGFDPWTGLPYGPKVEHTLVDGHGKSARVITQVVPSDMVGRRAIPLPVGFALGVVVSIGLLTVRSRNHQSTLGHLPEQDVAGPTGRPVMALTFAPALAHFFDRWSLAVLALIAWTLAVWYMVATRRPIESWAVAAGFLAIVVVAVVDRGAVDRRSSQSDHHQPDE